VNHSISGDKIMAAKKNFIEILVPKFRLSYPHLIEAVQYKEDGIPKGDFEYKAQMIFDPDDLSQFKVRGEDGNLKFKNINDIIRDIIKLEWPDITIKEHFHLNKNWSVIDGDYIAAQMDKKEKEGGENYVGKKIINTKTKVKQPPQLQFLENDKRKNIPRTDTGEKHAAQLFVGGNYCRAGINIVPLEVSGTKYTTFYLQSIVFIEEGERLGRKSIMDLEDFSGYQGEASHDPTEGLDDEIPF